MHKKLLLFHGSDLFFGSGTSTIYRRILSELVHEYEIHHFVGPHRSNPNEADLAELYAGALPGIKPVFPPKWHWMKLKEKLIRRLSGKLSLNPSLGWSLSGLVKLLKSRQFDLVWWSADYMPWSLSVFEKIQQLKLLNIPIELSVYDPPEFWGVDAFVLYNTISKVNGVDVVGSNYASLLARRVDCPITIMHDYIDTRVTKPARDSSVFRIGIAGQIYEEEELQDLVNLLSLLDRPSECIWYGNRQNYIVADRVEWNDQVQMLRAGSKSREEVVNQLAGMNVAYFSMPSSRPEFCRYSIPTKLITYIQAGLPIAFHAPLDSEVEHLNQQYNFGINLSQRNSAEALQELMQKREQYQANIACMIDEQLERNLVIKRAESMFRNLLLNTTMQHVT